MAGAIAGAVEASVNPVGTSCLGELQQPSLQVTTLVAVLLAIYGAYLTVSSQGRLSHVSADMVPIYFLNRPNPIVLAEDGRINFLPFDMIPDTIVVNGVKGLVGNDGLSVIPIKELVNLGYLQPNAGTPVDPLRVEGKLLTGEEGYNKETWAPFLMTLPRYTEG
ncbi:hypothetical protein WJX82_009203 [Trebouxia sp. C0006]